MKKRINHTGRHRLTSEMYTMSLQRDGARLTYTLDRLDYSTFPDIAEGMLVVEAYRGAHYERDVLGALSQVTFGTPRPLEQFTDTNRPLFRLKVVDKAARLLAEADKIRPLAPGESPGKARSLLVVEPCNDMGDLAWRISEDAPPALQINSKLGSPEAFFHHPGVEALILPEAMRQILVIAERQKEEADEVEWVRNWLRFGEVLAGPRKDTSSSAEWITRAVEQFARKHNLLNQLTGWIEEDES